jgi:hypothetical protein
MPLILPGNVATATASTTFNVANSVRMDGSGTYMTKTLGTPTDIDKYTFSFWCKRAKIGAQQSIFRSTNDAASNDSHVTFQADDTLRFEEYGGGATIGKLQTNQVFRDVSAWYHIVLVYDSGNATAGNRMRMYVNGAEVTSFGTDTNPSQDADSYFNKSGEVLSFGRTPYSGGSTYFDGYVAELVMCDGQAYAASDFGEYDSDSPQIWKPKDVSGLTFGNNGFYLDFEDSSNLGNDANGGTDFTEAGLAAIDQATDTCTNNFATMNPLFARSDNVTFTDGNLKGALASEGNQIIASTIAVSAGKWFFEFQANSQAASAYMEVGIFPTRHTTVTPNYIGGLSDGYSLMKDGNFYNNNSATSTGVTYGTSDIMGVALDLDSGTKTIKYYKNGSLDDGTTQNITVTEDVYIGWRGFANAEALSINFGSPKDSISSGNADGNGYGNFEYSVPSGYYSICTKNLAEFGG